MDCGRVFVIPLRDVAWLAEALRRNPQLKIICSACGRYWQELSDRRHGFWRG